MAEETRPPANESTSQPGTEMGSATPTAGGASRVALAGVVIVLIVLVVAAVWQYVSSTGAAAESDARQRVEELGAFIPGAKDKPATTVNVSTAEAQQNLDEIVAQLPALVHLTTFNATGAPIRDEHLQTIGQLDSLIALILSGTEVTDDGMRHLTGLDNLTNLELYGTSITNEGLHAIGEIRPLKTLNIGGTQVSGDLAPLAGLSNLEWLLVNELELSDDVVETLAQLDKITHLTAQRATISEEALTALSRRKPGMKIDR